MREKYPGSLQAAFREETKRHSAQDPHFEVASATVENGQTQLNLRLVKPFSLSVSVPASESQRVGPKLRDFFEFGRPLELTTDDAAFSGLPLLEAAQKKGVRAGITIEPEKFRCEVTLTPASQRGATPLILPATISRGSEGGEIATNESGSPLGIKMHVNRKELVQVKACELTLPWDISAWAKRPLASLPHVESVAVLTAALAKREPIDLRITQTGNQLLNTRVIHPESARSWKPHAALCEMLKLAREVAIARGFDTVFPTDDDRLEFDWSHITTAHALVTQGKHSEKAPNLRISHSGRLRTINVSDKHSPAKLDPAVSRK